MTAPRIIAFCMALVALSLAGCGGSKTASTATGRGAGTTGPSTATGSGAATPTEKAPAALGSKEVSPGVVRAASQDVTATMRASGHHPHVNAAWPVSFTVARGGKPVKAEVRYQYLFAGQVVARRSHYRFKGAFHDIFKWPSSAVGYPLTFRAAITVAGVTLNLDYPVQVQK